MLHITQKIAMKLSKVQIGNGKKMFLVKIISDVDNTWEDLCHLWQYHVLVKICLFACSNTESQICKSDFHFSGDSNLSYMNLVRHVHLEQVFQDQLQKNNNLNDSQLALWNTSHKQIASNNTGDCWIEWWYQHKSFQFNIMDCLSDKSNSQ